MKTTTENWQSRSRRAKETIVLCALSFVAVVIPIALVAQAAAGGDDNETHAPPTAAPDSIAVSLPDVAAPIPRPDFIGFESCTVINGLIPADTDGDSKTDGCWALDGAGDRPDECPAAGMYQFADTNADGIVDTCDTADFICVDGHPHDSDDDGVNDDCLTLDQWVASLGSAPAASPVATATPQPPRPTATPPPTATTEPYWSQPA